MTARPPETDESTAYTVMLQRPPVSQVARQRVTLGTQVALLVTGVTALTVLLAGLVLLGLVKGAAESQARETLAGQADLAATATAERTQPVQLARALRDRKSTRLNSSHVKISYAVFCLKKKKKKKNKYYIRKKKKKKKQKDESKATK